METILEHIASDLSNAKDPKGFVASLGPNAANSPSFALGRLDGDEEDILNAARRWLAQRGFPGAGHEIDYDAHTLTMAFEHEYDRNEYPFVDAPGLTSEKVNVRIKVQVVLFDDGRTRISVNKPLKSLSAALLAHLEEKYAAGGRGAEVLHNPICAPGKPIEHAWTGTLLDYSGCAQFNEVDDLVRAPGDVKALPLGYYRFTPGLVGAAARPSDAAPAYNANKLLWLGTFHSKARMEYNGVLIVAPQNSGKTELIVRWAVAANRAGHNVLVVDVKGNLIERLKSAGLAGKVWHYTTDPEPQAEAHRLNLLADVDCSDRSGRHRLQQLVDAVIRLDERDGKNQDWWITQKMTLEALVLLLKLRDARIPGPIADFADVYEHAIEEERLIETICEVWDALPEEAASKLGEPGLDRKFLQFIVAQLSGIIDRKEKRLPEGMRGDREERYSYRSLTYGVAMALNAFNRYGTLYPSSQGKGDFRLRDLDGADQCTIVLAAREQDGDIARTVLTMAIKRVEQILYDRRKVAEPSRPILLLLDETRRIRGFDAADFITFARDAKAGCVLVYQSLMQIEDEKDRTTILENVGTQIYLRSVSGKTAEEFIDLLPKKSRPTFSITRTKGEGRSTSVQTGVQDVAYIGQPELYRLPAGANPALVFIKDHRAGKPFLVDMTREPIADAIESFHKGGSP